MESAPTINIAGAGQVIPLKFRITDASGTPVMDLVGAAVTVTSLECSPGSTANELEEYTSGDSGLKNQGDGYYI